MKENLLDLSSIKFSINCITVLLKYIDVKLFFHIIIFHVFFVYQYSVIKNFTYLEHYICILV